MKRIFITIIFLFIGLCTYGQTHRNIEGVSVTFPNTPEYFSEPFPMYMVNTENVIVQVHIYSMSGISEFQKIKKTGSKTDLENAENVFLKNIIDGMTASGNLRIKKSQDIKIKNYRGKDIEATQYLSQLDKTFKAYIRFLIVKEKVVLFNCQLINDTQQAYNEKNKFLNSIK